MPSKPSCCTPPSWLTGNGSQASYRTNRLATWAAPERIQDHGKIAGPVTPVRCPRPFYWLAFRADDRACRHPGVEALLRRGDGELIAVPGQHSGLPWQRQHLLADRAELPGKVGEVVVVRDRPSRRQHVAAENGPDVLPAH